MIGCKEFSKEYKQAIRQTLENSSSQNPTLAVIQVGNNQASNSYIKGKKKDCEEVGIDFKHIVINEADANDGIILNYIHQLNKDKNIHGIIVQLPLPKCCHIKEIQSAISKEKDVDGFRADSEFYPCTPLGILLWLRRNNISIKGKDIVVIGRSNIVGKPLVKLLIEKGATVTCCNSNTEDLRYYTKHADIIITAIGKPRFFTSSYFGEKNKLIIDVGINRDHNGCLCGDVDRENINKLHNDIYITPVPGGVGLLTRVALMHNLSLAFKGEGDIEGV